ncbi:MAG: 6-phosphogluconolactonase [Chitinophagaceae bacterium]|nr:6-phosphogluconolactonase [Chitinophagaceae bacterium]
MRELKKGNLAVWIFETRAAMGAAAAAIAAYKIAELLEQKEFINIVFAAAPSQNEFLASLLEKEVDWKRVNAFHMDEYVGLNSEAPQLFGNFLKERFFGKVELGNTFYLNGSALDLDQECKRYTELLEKYPTDIVFLGIGENTHVAFNDPHVADFNDPLTVKIVDLDEKNRRQQVDPDDPSCFNHIEEVPTHAITLTVPALFKADHAYAIAPGERKADAIYHTLNEEIQENYPSTIFRKHSNAVLFIDEKSAARLA